MRTDAPLKSRHQEILTSIVRAYIETGEPVGSRTHLQAPRRQLSPASIRNVMADLADEGYLSQPHTSAGPHSHREGLSFLCQLAGRRHASARPKRTACAPNSAACDTVGRAWNGPATS